MTIGSNGVLFQKESHWSLYIRVGALCNNVNSHFSAQVMPRNVNAKNKMNAVKKNKVLKPQLMSRRSFEVSRDCVQIPWGAAPLLLEKMSFSCEISGGLKTASGSQRRCEKHKVCVSRLKRCTGTEPGPSVTSWEVQKLHPEDCPRRDTTPTGLLPNSLEENMWYSPSDRFNLHPIDILMEFWMELWGQHSSQVVCNIPVHH